MHGCCGIFNDDPDASVTYYNHCFECDAKLKMSVSMAAESTAMKRTSEKVPSSVVCHSSCVSIAPEHYTPGSAASSPSKSLQTKMAPQSLSKSSSKSSSQKRTA